MDLVLERVVLESSGGWWHVWCRPVLYLLVLAFIALAMVPIPFALYKFGHKIRSLSKHAHHPS